MFSGTVMRILLFPVAVSHWSVFVLMFVFCLNVYADSLSAGSGVALSPALSYV